MTGTKSVIEAIEGGREAAQSIDRYLGGDGDILEILLDADAPEQHIGRRRGTSTRRWSQIAPAPSAGTTASSTSAPSPSPRRSARRPAASSAICA